MMNHADPEVAADFPWILPNTASKSHKIWLIRKWRSMPRFVKLYVILLMFILLIVLCLISATGTLFSHKLLDANSRQSSGIVKTLNDEKASDQGASMQTYRGAKEGDEDEEINKKLFNFHPDNTHKEISFEKDLMNQKMNQDQLDVVEAMKHSWSGYKKYAWGADHLRPMTQGTQNWFNVGLSIIDSLDTLLLLGMKSEYEDAKQWVEKTLTFDIYKDVNCFEMTIRVLGGLLSAFHLTKEAEFLGKSLDVGDRLIHCFDSPSKVPYSDVNLRTKNPKSPSWSPDSSLSEVSSVQLEFRDLSRLVKQPMYEEKSFSTSSHLHDLVKSRGDPLLPMFVNPNNGHLTASTITLGARGDSYYEYLLKQYLQTGITWLRDDYLDAVDAIKSRLVKETFGPMKFKYVAELLRKSTDVNPKMDHLVCFLPGTLALGHYHYERHLKRHYLQNGATNNDTHGDDPNSSQWPDRFADHLILAEELARTCYNMYNMTATGLSPEIVYFGTSDGDSEMYIRPADSHNLLRPEYVESLFYLYHITGKNQYRVQGRQSFNKYCRVPTGGYTTIDDVRFPEHVRPKNMMESFWMAETLKYLYLLFSDDTALVSKLLNHYVFNTEAHLIPINHT